MAQAYTSYRRPSHHYHYILYYTCSCNSFYWQRHYDNKVVTWHYLAQVPRIHFSALSQFGTDLKFQSYYNPSNHSKSKIAESHPCDFILKVQDNVVNQEYQPTYFVICQEVLINGLAVKVTMMTGQPIYENFLTKQYTLACQL